MNIAEIKNLPLLKKRDANSHKGSYGKILVIAGSRGMIGAAYLTTSASLRSGAGLVTLATPETELSIAATKLTCAMTYPLPATSKGTIASSISLEILEMANSSDAVAIGPGMSQNKETQFFIQKILPLIQAPVVIDADGLNAIVFQLGILKKRQFPTIITPHPGEFSRLSGHNIPDIAHSSIEFSHRFAQQTNTVIVLKVAPSIVVNAHNFYRNTTGNPGMATGGSGDVLTGMIATLLAQKFSPFEAAQLGVHIHGIAGDLARSEKGEIGMIASDILSNLPNAFQKYSGQG